MNDDALQLLQQTLESSPLPTALVVQDQDGLRLLWKNSPFSAANRSLDQWLAAAQDTVAAAKAENRPARVFSTYDVVSGQERMWRWTISPVANGKPGAHSLIVGLDVSDLQPREAQGGLSSPGQLEAALRAGRVGTWVMNIAESSNTLDMNLSSMLGYPPATRTISIDEFMGYIHADDRQRVWNNLQTTIRGGPDFAEQFRVVRRDGAVRWFSDSGRLFRDADGRPTLVLGACVDLTEQHAVQSALHAVEARYRRLVDSITDHGIIMLDPERRVTHWNGGAEKIFGYTAEEIVGRSGDIIFSAEDREKKAPEYEAQQALVRGRFPDERWHVRKGGELGYMSGIVQPVHGEGRELLGFVKVVRDRTKEREAEAEIREAKEVAERANHAKDQFLAVLSHELRTPLNPVLMTVSMLEADPSVPDRMREDIQAIRQNVELEARLIDDLLDLTRVTRGKVELDRTIVDVHALLEHVVRICHPEAARKQLTVVTEAHAVNHSVDGDVTRLRQVFWNVLKNAIKFSNRGGRVLIRTRNEGDLLIVEVTDVGIGIDPEKIPQIFDAFRQADASITQQFGGLGLGLAISQALVELHGGAISASSQGRGTGTTITTRLKTVQAPVEQDKRVRTDPPPSQTLARKVLLVEDHEATAQVMMRLLRILGCDVTWAGTVTAALTLGGSEHFDLLISDLSLPDGSGLEVMRGLRERAGLKGIVVTGFGMEEDVRQTEQAGFAKHLTKPIDLQKLENAIREVG